MPSVTRNSAANARLNICCAVILCAYTFLLNNTTGRFTKECLAKCPETSRVHIVDNDLQIDADAFSEGRQLVSLVIDHSVSSPWYLPELFLKNNAKLRTVSFRHNNITGTSEKVFKSLKNLRKVDMRNNLIDRLEPGTFSSTSIVFVDLSHNKMTVINEGVFSFVSEPSSLNLSHNRIDKIGKNAFAHSHKLVVLDMSHNRITWKCLSEGTFDDLSSLTKLDLSFNRLTRLLPEQFAKMDNLKFLRANQNPITTIGPELPLFMSRRPFLNVDLSECSFKCICGALSAALEEAQRLKVNLQLICDSGLLWDVLSARCPASVSSSEEGHLREKSDNTTQETDDKRIVWNNSLGSNTSHRETPSIIPEINTEATYTPVSDHLSNISHNDSTYLIGSDDGFSSQQTGMSHIYLISCSAILFCALLVFIIILVYRRYKCGCKRCGTREGDDPKESELLQGQSEN